MPRRVRCGARSGSCPSCVSLGIEIRAGIHAGEIERRETGLGGIGVHIAARVLGQAGPGQVLVTRTVRDLATGTDLGFASVGTVSLRGVPGTWELFEASLDSARPAAS